MCLAKHLNLRPYCANQTPADSNLYCNATTVRCIAKYGQSRSPSQKLAIFGTGTHKHDYKHIINAFNTLELLLIIHPIAMRLYHKTHKAHKTHPSRNAWW